MTGDTEDLIRVRSGGKDERDRKAGGGLLPSASSSTGGELALGDVPLQPWVLRMARLNGGYYQGCRVFRFEGLYGQFMKFIGSQSALAIVIGATLAVSGFGMLDMNKRGGFGKPLPPRAKAFQARYSPDQLQGLPGSEQRGPSALALAQKANSGLYDAPAKAGGTEEGAGAKDEAGAGEAGGAESAEAAAAGQAPEQSLGAAQQSAAKMVASPLGRFAQKSSLNGGMGMTGGINGAFKQPKLDNTALAQAKSFANPTTGKVTRGMTPASSRGGSGFKSATARRLDRMNRAMGPTKTGNAEAGSAIHTQEWSNAQPLGNSIQGAGASSPGPLVGGETPAGGTPIEDPTTQPSAQQSAPDVGGTENVTPWQQAVDAATLLLALAAILIVVAYEGWVVGGALPMMSAAMAKIIAQIAVGMAAMVTLLGLAMMAQGQMMQGLIFTATGGLTTYMAYQALLGDPESLDPDMKQYALASSIGGALAGQLAKGKLDK